MVLLPMRARAFGIAFAMAVTSQGLFAAVPASAVQAPWNIQVGGGDFMATSLNRFYPANITVHRGDVVNFNWAGFHTVTFNPPAGKSVLDYVGPPGVSGSNTLSTASTVVNGTPTFGPGPGGPPPFTLNIGAGLPAGDYKFQCMLHQFMHGVITVSNESQLPSTDAQNQALAQTQIAADMARAAKLNNELVSHPEDHVQVGASTRVVELLNFFPTAITVRSGEELSFNDPDLADPHTVNFGPESPDPLAQLLPSGNPRNVKLGDAVSSGFMFSRSQYDYWNLKVAGIPGLRPNTEFNATFNNSSSKTQTFPFYCALHGGISPDGKQVFGMSGYITVLPAKADDGGGGNTG
jgi:plastocyanin